MTSACTYSVGADVGRLAGEALGVRVVASRKDAASCVDGLAVRVKVIWAEEKVANAGGGGGASELGVRMKKEG